MNSNYERALLRDAHSEFEHYGVLSLSTICELSAAGFDVEELMEQFTNHTFEEGSL